MEITKSQIDKAGKILRQENPDKEKLKEAIDIVNKWRSLHVGHLEAQLDMICLMAEEIDLQAVYARRLKKIKSIKNKLKRQPNMSLSTMQDIGGIRLICSSLNAVGKLEKLYLKKDSLKKIDNYIETPKKDGYRGIHASYVSEKELINMELQIRTKLQHIWATASETTKLITGHELKFGEGEADWKRFFALMSSLFAMQEGTPTIPDTPTNRQALINEIKELNERNKFVDKFEELRTFTEEKLVGDFDYFLLYINREEKTHKATGYKDFNIAYEDYVKNEEKENSVDDVVLVSTNSIESLKSAYPNYFADMNEFITILKNILNA